jgi:hypothetical protein
MRWVALVVAALLAAPLTGNAFPSSAASSTAAQKSREQAKPRPAPKPSATPAKKRPTSKADSAKFGSAARAELLKKKLQQQDRAKKAPSASGAQKVVPKAKAKGRS